MIKIRNPNNQIFMECYLCIIQKKATCFLTDTLHHSFIILNLGNFYWLMILQEYL